MTRQEAIRLAIDILRPFTEAGNIYDDYKADEGFTDEQFEAMLAVLASDDPASEEGPWSVLYEAAGDIHRIGPFDSREDAEGAATTAQADGDFDIADQRVYLLGPDRRVIVLTEDDLKGGDTGEYDAELAADPLLERQELEDFEGLSPFE